MGEWTLNPGVIASLLVAEVLYVRALRVLGARGVAVPRLQVLAWHGGLALWIAGLLSPIDAGGHEGLTLHMVQHLLIADLAAPLFLLGIRNPVLVFLLPRPLLVAVARRPRLRGAFRLARRPLVAIGIYALVLYLWHFPFLFETSVQSDLVHAVQHGSFVGIGVLVWWSALEPKRRRLRGELWKIPHIIAARLLGMFLGMAFVVTRVPLYTDVYGSGERALGLSAVADQQTAGGIMMITDGLIMVGALTFFFWRAAQQADRDEAAAAT